MKKLVFFICICSLLLLGACSSNGGGIIDLPKEIKLNITVSNDLVKIGETVTVTCWTENADRTSNNIGAPTGISWNFPLVVTQKTTITVVAYGSGKSISQDKTVDVLPVIIPTMKDSLAAHGWKLKSREYWQISTNTVISRVELSSYQLSRVMYFTLDGYIRYFINGKEDLPYSGGKYNIVGRTITSPLSNQVITITLLTDSELKYEEIYQSDKEQKIVWSFKAIP